MPEGEKSARNQQRDKKSPQSNKWEWICQIMQVQKRVSYGCKGDCSVGCALASPALCWKLPLNQSTQNVTELRPAVVSRVTFSMSLMHASSLQEWLHSASWDNTAPWSVLCSKWQWLRAPQMLAEREQAICIALFACALLCPFPGVSLAHMHYLELFAGRELFVWTLGHIWFLTSSPEDVHRRVLHQLLQFSVSGYSLV